MNKHDDKKQEKAFYLALKKYGYVFPETEDELKDFEESISRMKFSVPEKFSDPLKVVKDGRINKVGDFDTFYDDKVEENLAQAAREGSDIPDDVQEQMQKDRKKAEEDGKDDKDGID